MAGTLLAVVRDCCVLSCSLSQCCFRELSPVC